MFQWVEEHPYLTGGLVLGVFVIIVVMRRGSSASDGGTVSTYDPSLAQAGLAAQTGLDAARINLSGQIAGMNAYVNIAQLNNAADVEKTRIGSQVALASIYATRDTAFHDTDAALTYGLASLQSTGILPLAPAPTTINMIPVVSGGQTTFTQGTPINGVNIPNAGTLIGPAQPGYVPPGGSFADYFAVAGGPNAPGDFNMADSWQGFQNWVGAETAYIQDPNSLHNLPPGDWYDASGRLQSGPKPTVNFGDNCGYLNGVPVPCGSNPTKA